MSRFEELREDRNDDVRSWFRWYFHPRKFAVDNGLHAAIGFAALLPIALAASFPWWAGALASSLAAIPREVEQWPPRRIAGGVRAYFDPLIDVVFFGVGGLAAAFVPAVF